MKALFVGGPRHGQMVTVSDRELTDAGLPEDADAGRPEDANAGLPEDANADDYWPRVFVDILTAATYRRYPVHYNEPSPLLRWPRCRARYEGIVYVHESITTDAHMAVKFPQAATVWWFRTTGMKATANDPPVVPLPGQTNNHNGGTDA